MSESPRRELSSVHTSNFPDLLRHFNMSLAVTTYQAGQMIFLRPDGDTLNTHFRTLDRPMGLAYHQGHLAIGCGAQIFECFNVPAVAHKLPPEGRHDACFMPRRSHLTGDIDIHEMVLSKDDKLWFVNTSFSCLCNLDLRSSFFPVWYPPFITQLVPEDRCHLNGLALVDGQPQFVTALGISNHADGWRENKNGGGVVIDITTDQIVLDGLSMPHSPRWYRDRLWLLESGQGSFGWVDQPAGKYQKLCDLPGYTRGLDFVGPLAFVGLSQVRESDVFGGVPLANRLSQRLCGIYVVNIESGDVVAFLHFTGDVQEVFAVQTLPDMLYPEFINEDNEWLRHTYVLPEA
ncbi:MAG: TIGR03032 family protein [Planctomycetales bacterium]|nr:TIGR03032 family protein [Planctomycetales bacterium]